jgi:protein-disulfide isomerase
VAGWQKGIEIWHRLVEDGHRTGPDDALETIIEYGEYECPRCRAWQPQIEAVLRRNPEDVSFVYKHCQLSYHRRAYPAVRAAECVGAQARFWEMHRILFTTDNWLGDAFLRLAAQAGIGDIGALTACLAGTEPVPAIEASIGEASELQGLERRPRS